MIRQTRPPEPTRFASDAYAWLTGYSTAKGRNPRLTIMARSYLEEYAPKLAKPLIPHPYVDGADKVAQLSEILRRYSGILSA